MVTFNYVRFSICPYLKFILLKLYVKVKSYPFSYNGQVSLDIQYDLFLKPLRVFKIYIYLIKQKNMLQKILALDCSLINDNTVNEKM